MLSIGLRLGDVGVYLPAVGYNPSELSGSSLGLGQVSRCCEIYFFFFLWPRMWHMEIPRLGVELVR